MPLKNRKKGINAAKGKPTKTRRTAKTGRRGVKGSYLNGFEVALSKNPKL